MTTLLPCPFCNRIDIEIKEYIPQIVSSEIGCFIASSQKEIFIIECINCHAQSCAFKTQKKAIAGWNTREGKLNERD